MIDLLCIFIIFISLCAPCMCSNLSVERAKENIRFPKTRITSRCYLPWGCWRPKPSLLQEEQILLLLSVSLALNYRELTAIFVLMCALCVCVNAHVSVCVWACTCQNVLTELEEVCTCQSPPSITQALESELVLSSLATIASPCRSPWPANCLPCLCWLHSTQHHTCCLSS